MKHDNHMVPFADFDSPAAARLAVQNAAHVGNWAEVGIFAEDDRVMWTEEPDGIVLHFRSWQGEADGHDGE